MDGVARHVLGRGPGLILENAGGGFAALDVHEVRSLFATHGALWCRGFGASLEQFRMLSRGLVGTLRIGPVHRRRHRLYPDVQTATEGTAMMPLHVEYGSMPGRAEVFCLFA